jgi:hypothetical protein
MEAAQTIETIIGLFLFLYVMGAMLPSAITSVVNASNSSTPAYTLWGSSILSLWGILSIFIVIAVVIMIFGFVKKQG